MDPYSVPKKLPFSKKFLSAKVVLSYIFDYVIIVVLILAFIALDKVEPYHQRFSLRNYTLQYPFAVHERVPVPALLIICVVAPAVIIAVYTLIIDGLFSSSGGRKKYPFKKRLWELNCGVLGLLLAVGASFVITGTLKNAIGKPRPDLIARCNITAADVSGFFEAGNYSLAGHEHCHQSDNAILKDGFRSFPSGHSSSAWAGLFYLSLYLTGKMHVLDSRGEVWKTFLVLIPTLGAALVAGSRIMDARHHPFDVLSGSLLGILVAWASYRQYFPPVSDFRAKGRAYPIRTWGRLSEDKYQDAYQQDVYNDRVPLRQDYPPPQVAFSSGRHSPPTGNVFQDEIRSSQRRRAQEAASSTYSGLDRSQTDTPPPAIPPIPSSTAGYGPQPSTTPAGFGRGNSRRQFRRDDWEDSSEDEATSDLELQHQYTISGQSGQGKGQGHYGGAHNPFEEQDTSYNAQPGSMPPKRLPSQRAAGRVPDTVAEGVDGDSVASKAPQPPAHQEPVRGVQLVETYGPSR